MTCAGSPPTERPRFSLPKAVGTDTSIQTCQGRICRTISRRLVLEMNNKEARMSGGTKDASA